MKHECQPGQPSDGQQFFGGEKNAPRPEEPQPVYGPPIPTPLRGLENERPRPRNPWGRLGKPPSEEERERFRRDRAKHERALFYGQLSLCCRRRFPDLPTVDEITAIKEEFEKKLNGRVIDLAAVLHERAEPLLVSERFRVETGHSRLSDPDYQGDIPLHENIIDALKRAVAPDEPPTPHASPEDGVRITAASVAAPPDHWVDRVTLPR